MKKTNVCAIIALVGAILGFIGIFPVVGSGAGIICGHIARKQIRDSHGMEDGDGLAIVGLILGYLGIGIWLLTIVLVLLYFFGMLGILGLGFIAAIFAAIFAIL